MASSIESNPMSRREFLKKASKASLGLVSLGLLGILQACSPKSPDTPTPKFSPEIVGLPAVLEMPFGSKFIVETKPPHPQLNINKTLTEKLLHETVRKPTVSIKVSIYPDDWIKPLPNVEEILLINDQIYQSLPEEEGNTFKDGFTRTTYDPVTRAPKRAAVYIAAGRYLKAAAKGKSMLIQNEFLPEGITVNPIIALNATFYNQVRYHAILRNVDYRKPDETGLIKEEIDARKGETEWIKSLTTVNKAVSNHQLFLVPH